MAELDLVISVDSATVHMAGALGVPVWTLLHFAANWRWLLDRDDTPWYPSMRLVRQPEFGQWDAGLRIGCRSLLACWRRRGDRRRRPSVRPSSGAIGRASDRASPSTLNPRLRPPRRHARCRRQAIPRRTKNARNTSRSGNTTITGGSLRGRRDRKGRPRRGAAQARRADDPRRGLRFGEADVAADERISGRV